jgi:hypothetical protein
MKKYTSNIRKTHDKCHTGNKYQVIFNIETYDKSQMGKIKEFIGYQVGYYIEPCFTLVNKDQRISTEVHGIKNFICNKSHIIDFLNFSPSTLKSLVNLINNRESISYMNNGYTHLFTINSPETKLESVKLKIYDFYKTIDLKEYVQFNRSIVMNEKQCEEAWIKI